MRVAIIGGGISGLAAAYRLQEIGKSKKLPLQITLLESQERFGGIIETDSAHGCFAEGGPDSFIADKPWALDLCKRLDLASEIIETNPEFRRSFILFRGKLFPVPAGFYLCAPSDWNGLWNTQLLSLAGKLRAAAEWLIPAKQAIGDETVGSFIRRRMGREVFERIGQPMISGIYTGDPEKLSMKAAMPRLVEMEKEFGSLIRALQAAKKDRREATGVASGPRYSLFLSLKGGLQRLVDKLKRALTETEMMCASRVESIALEQGIWRLSIKNKPALEADAVCMALPAPNAARILQTSFNDLAQMLRQIPYESVVTVNMLFNRLHVGHPLDGFGFVVPRCENKPLIGCSFSSVKYQHRVENKDHVLLRAYAGGALQRELLAKDDGVLTDLIQREVSSVLKIENTPVWSHLTRLESSMPQYHLGHKEKIDSIIQVADKYPGLFLTGNAYDGVGIPDCIHHAELTADKIAAFLPTALESQKQHG